jgi:DNA repair exonuclease SbcCD ATPase subunit
MDEQYELISKSELKQLKEENKQLKQQLQNLQTTSNKTIEPKINLKKINEEIKKTLQEHVEQEKQILIQEIKEIKELNKTTLSNVISKSQTLESKLETMVETLQELTSNLSELISKVPEQQSKEEDDTIRDDINITLVQKLEEIDTFMKNLRILLSYVKPSDMVMEKPSRTPQPQTPPFQNFTPPPM